MHEKKIRVTELARAINLPQPTVHRIVSGVCEHPHYSSLSPIANYFSITVDQLKGLDPISSLDKIKKVPLLAWNEVDKWIEDQSNFDKNREYVITDAETGKNGFALQVKDASMDPVFPLNTILIVNSKKQARDRSFVIIIISKQPEIIFRQLLINAGDYYLKSLSPDFEKFKMTCMSENDRLLGVIVQAKRNYEN